MGLSSILSTAASGLNTVQAQLQWRTDNINNSSNVNYSRRDPTTVSIGAHGTAVTIARAKDAGLTTQYLDANSQSSAATVTSDFYSKLADVAGTSQSTPYLQQTMDDFTAAWKAFETDTSSTTSEAQIVSTGQSLADGITGAEQQLRQIRDEAKGAAGDAVTALNGKLSDLSEINKKLSADPNAATEQPDLLDQRDKLVSDVSGLVGVNVVSHSDGSVALYTKTGAVLVDKAAGQFQWNTNTGGQGFISMAGAGAGATATAPGMNASFSGGSLGATLNFLDPGTTSSDPNVGTLAKAQAQLDAFATQLADTSSASSFEGAYDAATSDRTTDLSSGFFTIDTTGTLSPSQSLAVNAGLVAGTSTIKRQSANDVVAQLTATTRSMSTAGVSAANVSYSGLASAIAGYQTDSQAAATSDKTRTTTTTTTLQTRLTSETGVNLDTEMAQMTVLQNAYSANAKVINAVESMFDTLLKLGS